MRNKKPVGAGVCLVNDCTDYAYRNLCKTHLSAAKLGYLDLEPSWGVETNPTCASNDCTRPATSRKPDALCIAHWQKAQKPPARSRPVIMSKPVKQKKEPRPRAQVIICADCSTRVLPGNPDRLHCKRHADQYAKYGFTWTKGGPPIESMREWRKSQCKICAVSWCEKRTTSGRAEMCATHQRDFARKHCSLEFYLAHMAITACESCGDQGKLVTDHLHGHHESERDMCEECIRGRLCGPCNTTFGMSREDSRRLARLTRYAKKHEAKKALNQGA